MEHYTQEEIADIIIRERFTQQIKAHGFEKILSIVETMQNAITRARMRKYVFLAKDYVELEQKLNKLEQ